MSDPSNRQFVPRGLEDDAKIVRNNLMEELCKRQSNFERNGGEDSWDFDEVRKAAGIGGFDREYTVGVVKAYQNQYDYFNIDTNNKIGLTSRGKGYCNALEQ